MPPLRGLALAAALLLTAGAAGCNIQVDGDAEQSDEEGEDEKKFRPDPRTLIEVDAVARGAVSDFLVSSGAVESELQADLTPETSGTVVKILAEEGDVVRAGQVLAIISNPNLNAGLARAQAELGRAQAELAQVQSLHGQGAISERELETAQHAVITARTGLTEAAGTQGMTRIASPIDGTVSVRELRYGEVAGGRRAFQVVDLDRLRVVVRLPERDLARLVVGMPAKLASVYAEDDTVDGEVVRISPTVDPATGTVRVTVALDREQTRLRPGQYVSVRVEVGRHEDVVVIPRKALLYEEGAPIAFRVAIEEEPEEDEAEEKEEKKKKRGWGGGRGDGEDEVDDDELPGPYRIARKITLETGFIDQDLVEITAGLAVDDAVVTTGHAALRDGARVRLPGDPRLGDEAEDGEKKSERAPDQGAEAEAG